MVKVDDTGKVHPDGRRGRGALSNRDSRFHQQTSHYLPDDWGNLDNAPPLRTEILRDSSKSIIATNHSPDLGFDRSINPYRGCEHGCVYCFARPTHAFLGYSPGLDFESRILIKPDAPTLLERALRQPRYRCRSIALGTNTDPYQPLEKQLKITREILQVLNRFQHPVGIVTKSHLVTRDIDLLTALAEQGLVKVHLSVTSLDADLARKMEPRAATPTRRLKAIAALAAAGIPTGVMVAPMIPALNDHEMERILAKAYDHGAREAGYILLRLPLEIKDLFQEWLEAHFPDRAQRVMNLMRNFRNGRVYDSSFGTRMTGTGPFADMLAKRFDLAHRQLGFLETPVMLDRQRFQVPAADDRQLQLL